MGHVKEPAIKAFNTNKNMVVLWPVLHKYHDPSSSTRSVLPKKSHRPQRPGGPPYYYMESKLLSSSPLTEQQQGNNIATETTKHAAVWAFGPLTAPNRDLGNERDAVLTAVTYLIPP